MTTAEIGIRDVDSWGEEDELELRAMQEVLAETTDALEEDMRRYERLERKRNQLLQDGRRHAAGYIVHSSGWPKGRVGLGTCRAGSSKAVLAGAGSAQT